MNHYKKTIIIAPQSVSLLDVTNHIYGMMRRVENVGELVGISIEFYPTKNQDPQSKIKIEVTYRLGDVSTIEKS